jgi:hypothetical protein
LFSCWILFLIVQTSLAAAGRVDVHRRLGLMGFGLACLMVVLGLMAATDTQVRRFVAGEAGMRVRASYTIPLTAILVFATLIYFAFRNRFNPAAHKRLILIATIAILDAARGGAHMYPPAAVLDYRLRLLVQRQGSSRHDLGRRIAGRYAAVAGSDRVLRPLSGFRRVGADTCAFLAHLEIGY